MNVFEVFATLGFNSDGFDSGLSAAEQRLQGIEKTFSGAGRSLTTHVSAPLLAIGAGALAVGADFESSMNQVQALTSASAEEFTQLRDMAKDMGATTQFSASEAADAMGFLAMAGQNTDEILGSMPGTLRLAAAANLDMASAADIATNIMAGYGIGVEELDDAVDVLVQSFTSANTDLPQLAEAMKYAGPVASAAGVEFEEAAAAISLMGNAGIQGSMAGTSLRGAISRILNPTAKASELMASMGLEGQDAAEMLEALEGSSDNMAATMQAAGLSFTDAAGRLLPLDEILQQLEPHADNAGLFMELFGQRAGPAMAALVSQGSGALTELTGSLHDSAGRAQEVADVQMQGLTGAMRLFKSATEAVLIAIADSGLLQAATDFLTLIAGWIQNLSEVNPMILRVATVLGGVLATLGPVIWAIGSFAGAAANLMPLLKLIPGAFTAIRVALGLLTGPIGWIITGITLLVTAFATDFLGIRTAVVNAWNAVVDAFKAAWEWITNFFGNFSENMTRIWDGIKSVFSGAATAVGNTFRSMGDGVSSVWGRIRDSFQAGASNVRSSFDSFRDHLGRTWDTIKGAAGQARDHVATAFTGMQEAGSAATTALSRLFRGDFKGAWDSALDAITGWWDTVNNFFGGLPQRMLDFGKNLISGLTDGIRNMASNAVDAITGLGGRLMDSFKGLLGIESPSRVFHGIGRDITEGLAQGIEAGTPRAVQAIGELGSIMGRAFTSAGSFEDLSGMVDLFVGDLEGSAAIRAMQDRVKELTRFQRQAWQGSLGASQFAQNQFQWQIDAFNEEIARLAQELRLTREETNRAQEVQTTRFARAVDEFDSGVRGLTLANQRQ